MYELIFWQYEEEIYLNHHEVYEQLSEGEHIAGLKTIENNVIISRIAKVFCDWHRNEDNSWENPSNSEAFHVKTTTQSIKIDCYGTNGKTMDILVSILDEYHCPLYDPQVPARYDEFFES